MTLAPSWSGCKRERSISTSKHTDSDGHHNGKEIAAHFGGLELEALGVESSEEVKVDSEMRSVID
jgi:hypothetical protein